MNRLIVGSIEILSFVLIVIFILVGLISGFQGGGAVGAVAGFVVSFAAAVVVFGALFILLEMNESLRAIRRLLEAQGGG